MTVFEKCRFSKKVSKTRFHIPLFGTVLIFSDIRVYIKKFKNYSTGFQAVTYPTLIVCKSISCKNFVDMKIFYTKRPYYKILLYFLCINTLQENPTFRTIRSGPPDRLKQRPVVVPIVNRSAAWGLYIIGMKIFAKKWSKNLHIVKTFSIFVMSERNRIRPDKLKIFKI